MTNRTHTGFASLQTLISNVQPAIQEAERRVKALAQASKTRSSGTVTDYIPNSPAVPRRAEPRATVRWGKMFAVAAVLIAIIMFLTQSTASEPSAESSTTSEPTAIREQVPSEPISSLASATDSLYQMKPVPGDGIRILTTPEIQYCLAEEIRIGSAESAVDKYNERQIDRFNELVQAYNDRCGRYQYRRGAVERARTAVEPYRDRLTAEGRARFR